MDIVCDMMFVLWYTVQDCSVLLCVKIKKWHIIYWWLPFKTNSLPQDVVKVSRSHMAQFVPQSSRKV